MPTYKYTAQDPSGKKFNGTIYAETLPAARQKLAKMRITPMTLEIDEGVAETRGGLLSRITFQEMVTFYSSVGIAINAGASLREALTAFSDQTTNPKLRSLLEDLVKRIEGGKSFSESLRAHDDVFANDFISLMSAAEKSGNMSEMLTGYVEYIEKQQKIRGKAIGAMVYPAVMAGVAVIVVILLTTIIFPKFIESFSIPFEQLPQLTQYVATFSNFLIERAVHIFIGGPLIFGTLVYLSRTTKQGKHIAHWLQFNAPVFGKLMRYFYVSRFAHVLGSQLKGGVPGLSALKVTREVTDNVYFQKIIDDVIESIRSGGSYAAPLRKHPDIIPPVVTLMFSIGEKTGSIGEVLEKVGNYYDEQVATTTEVLVSLIEPVMIVVMGVLVTIIAVSMFLPVFNMTKMIG